jgi:hypothetical protein
MSGSAGGSVTLREFLMRLGYSEDESSRRKMLDSVKFMTTAMIGLGTAVATASAAVVAGVAKMASVSEGMYYMSQRTGSSVKDINALKYAFSQLGGSAEEAQGLIERFADKMRESPGFEQLVRGITGKPFAGAVEGIKDVGTALNDMLNRGTSFSQVRVIAEQLGLTEADLMVLLRNTRQFSEEYTKMADKIIGNQQKVAEHGMYFMQRYRAFLKETELFAKRLGDELAVSLGDDLEKLRKFLFEHADEIKQGIEVFAQGVLIAGRAIAQFAVDAGHAIADVIAWYKKLDPETKALIQLIEAVGVAWLILNSKFLTSPLGIIAGLGVALVELYADYQNWKSGAEHFLPWDQWEPQIKGAISGMEDFAKAVDRIVHGFIGPNGWTTVLEALLVLVGGRWVLGILAAITRINTAIAVSLLGKLLTNPALLTFLASVGAGVAISRYIDDKRSDLDKAKDYAEGQGYTLINPGRPTGGYKDAQGNQYTTEQLAQMYAKKQGPDSEQQEKSAKEGYDFYIKKGMTPAGAAAMIAQEKAESGFDAGAVGDGGAARGMYQHHRDRRDAILAGSGFDVWANDPVQQREGAWWELHHTEKKALAEIEKAGNNPGVAGAAGSVFFERPSARNEQAAIRAQSARDYYRRYNGGGDGGGDIVPTVPTMTVRPRAPVTVPLGQDITVPKPGDHVPDTLPQTYPDVGSALTVPPAGVSPTSPAPSSGGGHTTVIHQTNTFRADHVTDPREAINALTRQLDRSNGDLLRNGNSNVG